MTQHCHRQGRAGHAPLPRDVGDDEHAPGDEIDAKPLMLASALAAFSPCGFAEDIDFGKMSYESSCAACHGQSGKGDGPVSADLRTKPTDLTLIAKRNGGVFPAEILYRII